MEDRGGEGVLVWSIGGVSPLYMGPCGAHHSKRREKGEGVQVWGIGGGFGEGFEWE